MNRSCFILQRVFRFLIPCLNSSCLDNAADILIQQHTFFYIIMDKFLILKFQKKRSQLCKYSTLVYPVPHSAFCPTGIYPSIFYNYLFHSQLYELQKGAPLGSILHRQGKTGQQSLMFPFFSCHRYHYFYSSLSFRPIVAPSEVVKQMIIPRR